MVRNFNNPILERYTLMGKTVEVMDKVVIITKEDIVEGYITELLPDDKGVEVTTIGVTAGEWKGPDVTNYDSHTKALADVVKVGLWLHHHQNLSSIYRKVVLQIAASRYSALGAASDCAWLGNGGTGSYGTYAYYMGAYGDIYYGSYHVDYSRVVAPAFNLKKSDLIYDTGLGAWTLHRPDSNIRDSYKEDIHMTLEQLTELEYFLDDVSVLRLGDIVTHLHICEDMINEG